MRPEFHGGNIRANCPTCGGAVTTFEWHTGGQTEFGSIVRPVQRDFAGVNYIATIFKTLRCAGCGSAGLAEVLVRPGQSYDQGQLFDFYPRTIDQLPLPETIPQGVADEFREAEQCASIQAWRSASAMLRSTLEKTLRANGYSKGSLKERIDQAAADGVITAARSKRAHEDIRVLGNDVLHDEWRAVSEEEFDQAHRYAQRILEDLYDDRSSVEAILIEKKRLAAPPE